MNGVLEKQFSAIKNLLENFRKKHQDIIVLEFDAFAYDYMKDAFLAITSQLLKDPKFKELEDL